MVVDLPEHDQRAVPPSLQGHEDGDVELDDVLGLRVVARALPLVLPGDDVVQFLEAVEGGLLASVGHVLADGEIGLVGIDVRRVGRQRALWGLAYFRAYL